MDPMFSAFAYKHPDAPLTEYGYYEDHVTSYDSEFTACTKSITFRIKIATRRYRKDKTPTFMLVGSTDVSCFLGLQVLPFTVFTLIIIPSRKLLNNLIKTRVH